MASEEQHIQVSVLIFYGDAITLKRLEICLEEKLTFDHILAFPQHDLLRLSL